MTMRQPVRQLLCGFVLAAVAALPSASHAQFSVTAMHDDADNGISPANNYTHAVDFSSGAVVNGVTFLPGGYGAFPGGEANIPNPLDAPGGLPGYVTGGTHDLLRDFMYGNPSAYVRLDGLTPGVEYETRFYSRNWDAANPYNRSQIVTVDVNADGAADDSTNYNADNPMAHVGGADAVVPTILAYRFTAASQAVQFNFQANNPGNDTVHLYALSNEVVGGAPIVDPAIRLSIPSLYSTGVDDLHLPLPDGAVDTHYVMTASADPAFPGPSAVVVNSAWPIAPAGPWIANSATAKWISARAEQNTVPGLGGDPANGSQPGAYSMVTTFDLTGFQADTAQIEMFVYADNAVDDILLNGVSTGFTAPGFDAGRYYVLNGPFEDGTNTLEFRWSNAPPGLNPAGLRVDLRGTAEAIPEPSTFVLAAMGAVALFGLRRRRK